MDKQQLRMLNAPWKRDQKISMCGWNFVGKIFEITVCRSVRLERCRRVVMGHPAFAPMRPFAPLKPAEGRAHCEFVVSHHCRRARMLSDEIERQVDRRLWIRASIDKIADKDHPSVLKFR